MKYVRNLGAQVPLGIYERKIANADNEGKKKDATAFVTNLSEV